MTIPSFGSQPCITAQVIAILKVNNTSHTFCLLDFSQKLQCFSVPLPILFVNICECLWGILNHWGDSLANSRLKLLPSPMWLQLVTAPAATNSTRNQTDWPTTSKLSTCLTRLVKSPTFSPLSPLLEAAWLPCSCCSCAACPRPRPLPAPRPRPRGSTGAGGSPLGRRHSYAVSWCTAQVNSVRHLNNQSQRQHGALAKASVWLELHRWTLWQLQHSSTTSAVTVADQDLPHIANRGRCEALARLLPHNLYSLFRQSLSLSFSLSQSNSLHCCWHFSDSTPAWNFFNKLFAVAPSQM